MGQPQLGERHHNIANLLAHIAEAHGQRAACGPCSAAWTAHEGLNLMLLEEGYSKCTNVSLLVPCLYLSIALGK